MSDDLRAQLAEYGGYHSAEQEPVGVAEIVAAGDAVRPLPAGTPRRAVRRRSRGGGWTAVAAAAVIVLLVGGAAWLSSPGQPLTTDQPTQTTVPRFDSPATENPSITPPDFAGALLGDDGVGPLPLGVVSGLPGEDYLDFLFEFCQPECYRDAHFMDPSNPLVGSGPWTAGRPFHVRHGFVNNGEEPLGEGFDVVMYVTRWDGPELAGGVFAVGQTYRYTSDYVLRGSSDQCGPTYKTQTGSETCEWFVHDFAEGLPEGRYDLWAVWEAPCSAWVGLGFTAGCADPNEVVSLFSAGVNSPFGSFPPSFNEANEAQLH